jgi:hypothetical protein
MTPRQIAQHRVDRFNRSSPVRSRVAYLKSEIEGLQITTVDKPAYIQGEDTPMVCLSGIGTALIDKVEPYFCPSATASSKGNLVKLWADKAPIYGPGLIVLLIVIATCAAFAFDSN